MRKRIRREERRAEEGKWKGRSKEAREKEERRTEKGGWKQEKGKGMETRPGGPLSSSSSIVSIT